MLWPLLPLGSTIVWAEKELSHPTVITLISLVVVAYGTEPGIAPCLVPWAFLTWGWVLGLPCAVHRMSLGGGSGSRCVTVMGNIPCLWISCSQSPLVCSVFFIFFFLFSVPSLGSHGQREGVHENPLKWIFVGWLREVSGVEPLPKFPHGLLVPCKTPTLSPRNKGNDFWSSLALRETWMINFNRYWSPQQQQQQQLGTAS